MASGKISSFKSIVNYMRKLSLSHLNVKQFVFGQESDIDVETNKAYPTKYPMVSLVPVRADFEEGGAVTFSFTLSVQDISVNDLDITEDTLNATFMILQDLISKIRITNWNEVDMDVELPIPVFPFMEARNNNVSGWSASVIFIVNNPFNDCDSAFGPLEPESCEPIS